LLEAWLRELEEALSNSSGRLNPASSLAATLTLLVMYSYVSNLDQLLFLIITSVVFVAISGASPFKVLKRLASLSAILIPIVLFTMFYRTPYFGMLLALRLFGAVLTATAFTLATNMVELVGMLERFMPKVLARNIILMARFIGQLYRSMEDSSLALKARILSKPSRLAGLRLIGYMLGSQMLRYIHYSHMASLGLQSRLIGTERWGRVHDTFKPIDVFLVVTAIIASIAVIVWLP